MSPDTIAILGVGVGLALLLFSLHTRLERRMDRLEDSLRSEIAGLREDLHSLTERVARIEGALSGPWRAPGPENPPGERREVEA